MLGKDLCGDRGWRVVIVESSRGGGGCWAC